MPRYYKGGQAYYDEWSMNQDKVVQENAWDMMPPKPPRKIDYSSIIDTNNKTYFYSCKEGKIYAYKKLPPSTAYTIYKDDCSAKVTLYK